MFCLEEHVCVYREVSKSVVQSESSWGWINTFSFLLVCVVEGEEEGRPLSLDALIANTHQTQIPAFIPVFQLNKSWISHTGVSLLSTKTTVHQSGLPKWDPCAPDLSDGCLVCSACGCPCVRGAQGLEQHLPWCSQQPVAILELQQCLLCPCVVASCLSLLLILPNPLWFPSQFHVIVLPVKQAAAFLLALKAALWIGEAEH